MERSEIGVGLQEKKSVPISTNNDEGGGGGGREAGVADDSASKSENEIEGARGEGGRSRMSAMNKSKDQHLDIHNSATPYKFKKMAKLILCGKTGSGKTQFMTGTTLGFFGVEVRPTLVHILE